MWDPVGVVEEKQPAHVGKGTDKVQEPNPSQIAFIALVRPSLIDHEDDCQGVDDAPDGEDVPWRCEQARVEVRDLCRGYAIYWQRFGS